MVSALKREGTLRDTLAPPLKYVSSAAQLTRHSLEEIFRPYRNEVSLSLAEHHRAYFHLAPDEVEALNKGQRIVIFGQQISTAICQNVIPEMRRFAHNVPRNFLFPME